MLCQNFKVIKLLVALNARIRKQRDLLGFSLDLLFAFKFIEMKNKLM